MDDKEESDGKTESSNLLPRWIRIAIFIFSSLFTFLVGTALEQSGIIDNKWWIITPSMVGLYWLCFTKKNRTTDIYSKQYEWGKKKY